MAWDYRRYGSATDPIHKSHLNDLTGDWGCPTRFRYDQDLRSLAGPGYDLNRPVRGDAACGTAAHETVARALTNPVAVERLLQGPGALKRSQIADVFKAELAREVGGRRVEWYDHNPEQTIADRISMIEGLFTFMHERVAEVVLVEPAFIAQLGPYWISGHIDLVYRPRSRPTAIALADWKTGAKRPNEIILDHSWESGVYSVALQSGWFLPRESLDAVQDDALWTVSHGLTAYTHPSRYIAERECAERVLVNVACAIEAHGASTDESLRRLGEFPSEIRHVHLADYVPYKRAGSKGVERAVDLAHYKLNAPATVKYVSGDLRGPAWLPVRMNEHDVPRVIYRVRNVVGMVRMGRFIDQIGDQCKRCAFAKDCLSTGYALRGDDAKDVERVLKGIDVESAADLNVDRD